MTPEQQAVVVQVLGREPAPEELEMDVLWETVAALGTFALTLADRMSGE